MPAEAPTLAPPRHLEAVPPPITAEILPVDANIPTGHLEGLVQTSEATVANDAKKMTAVPEAIKDAKPGAETVDEEVITLSSYGVLDEVQISNETQTDVVDRVSELAVQRHQFAEARAERGFETLQAASSLRQENMIDAIRSYGKLLKDPEATPEMLALAKKDVLQMKKRFRNVQARDAFESSTLSKIEGINKGANENPDVTVETSLEVINKLDRYSFMPKVLTKAMDMPGAPEGCDPKGEILPLAGLIGWEQQQDFYDSIAKFVYASRATAKVPGSEALEELILPNLEENISEVRADVMAAILTQTEIPVTPDMIDKIGGIMNSRAEAYAKFLTSKEDLKENPIEVKQQLAKDIVDDSIVNDVEGVRTFNQRWKRALKTSAWAVGTGALALKYGANLVEPALNTLGMSLDAVKNSDPVKYLSSLGATAVTAKIGWGKLKEHASKNRLARRLTEALQTKKTEILDDIGMLVTPNAPILGHRELHFDSSIGKNVRTTHMGVIEKMVWDMPSRDQRIPVMTLEAVREKAYPEIRKILAGHGLLKLGETVDDDRWVRNRQNKRGEIRIGTHILNQIEETMATGVEFTTEDEMKEIPQLKRKKSVSPPSMADEESRKSDTGFRSRVDQEYGSAA